MKQKLARAMYGSVIEGETRRSAISSTPTQVRERKVGDLFEYQIEHPVTIRRNQSALVPIVLRAFEGRPVLLYNKATRAENPMRCVEFKNTTGLTLEGGPVTVLEGGSYVGEAMLETVKPDEQRYEQPRAGPRRLVGRLLGCGCRARRSSEDGRPRESTTLCRNAFCGSGLGVGLSIRQAAERNGTREGNRHQRVAARTHLHGAHAQGALAA